MTFTSRKMSLKKEEHNVKIEGENKVASFEEAIEATGFGKFNIFLILLIIPSAFAIQFETSAMSYVFPVAQCDLDLSLDNKGLLNAAPYMGMVLSCFFWGIIADKFGRKKVLAIGYILDSIIILVCGFSNNFPMLLSMKLFGGFLINGPVTTLAVYICELHSTKYRARMQMFLGVVYGAGNINLPTLASLILPLHFHETFFGNIIVINSWNIFIFATSLGSIVAGVSFLFMPESPKYYMSIGENEKALEVFQKMYSVNSGKSKESYPITELEENNQKQKEKTECEDTKNDKHNSMLAIFRPPYLKNLSIVCFINFCHIMCINTLRLWLPQIFQAIHEHQVFTNGLPASMCEMLENLKPAAEEITSLICSVNLDNNLSVYFKSMTIGLVAMIGYVFVILIINNFGKRKIIVCLGILSGSFVTCVFLSQNSATILALTSISLALANICVDVVITIIVVIFPTSMRASALSMSSLFGRIGSIIGNLLFPLLLQTGCKPPFFLLGSIIIGSSISSMLLPNTYSKSIS